MKLITSTLMLLCWFSVSAQYFGIANLYIIPQNPVPGNPIAVVCSTYHASGPCDLLADSVAMDGDTIRVFGEHMPGILTYICYTNDTTWLGEIGDGQYTIIYYLVEHYQAGGTLVKTDTLTLNMIGTGFGKGPQPEQVHIAFDPLSSNVFVRLPEEFPAAVSLYDLTGREVIRQANASASVRLGTSSLVPGLYIVRLDGGNWRSARKLAIR
jgi:hypothetical protein